MYNGRKDTMRPSARNEMHVGNETGESPIITICTGLFMLGLLIAFGMWAWPIIVH